MLGGWQVRTHRTVNGCSAFESAFYVKFAERVMKKDRLHLLSHLKRMIEKRLHQALRGTKHIAIVETTEDELVAYNDSLKLVTIEVAVNRKMRREEVAELLVDVLADLDTEWEGVLTFFRGTQDKNKRKKYVSLVKAAAS